jgi:hypothetical protein
MSSNYELLDGNAHNERDQENSKNTIMFYFGNRKDAIKL